MRPKPWHSYLVIALGVVSGMWLAAQGDVFNAILASGFLVALGLLMRFAFSGDARPSPALPAAPGGTTRAATLLAMAYEPQAFAIRDQWELALVVDAAGPTPWLATWSGPIPEQAQLRLAPGCTMAVVAATGGHVVPDWPATLASLPAAGVAVARFLDGFAPTTARSVGHVDPSRAWPGAGMVRSIEQLEVGDDVRAVLADLPTGGSGAPAGPVTVPAGEATAPGSIDVLDLADGRGRHRIAIDTTRSPAPGGQAAGGQAPEVLLDVGLDIALGAIGYRTRVVMAVDPSWPATLALGRVVALRIDPSRPLDVVVPRWGEPVPVPLAPLLDAVVVASPAGPPPPPSGAPVGRP